MIPFRTTLGTLLRMPSRPGSSASLAQEPVSTPPADGDVFKFYRTVGNATALAILFVVLAEFVNNMVDPIDRDFISFWGAAKLVLAGTPSAAYDRAALHAVQITAATFGGGEMPFPYPPAFLLLLVPFGLLSFPLAMAAWTVATFPAYFATARRMFPDSGWLAAAFPPVLANGVLGQNAFVTAGLFIGGLLMLPKRPFLAGLLLGCLAIKPQLGLLLPVALLAAREWRAIAGAAISSVGVLLVGAAVFGIAATTAWIGQMPLYMSIARDGLAGWHKLASVYASMRQAGLGADAAFAIHIAVAVAAAGAVWNVWRRPQADPLAKAAILAAGTMLASPYLFLYDEMILVVPLLWLARSRVPPVLLALLWCIPIATIAQTYGFNGPVNLNPLLPLALLALVYREVQASPPQARLAPATV